MNNQSFSLSLPDVIIHLLRFLSREKMPVLATIFKECRKQADRNEIVSICSVYQHALLVVLAMYICM